MATYSVVRAKHATLVASTVDTINLSADHKVVQVHNRDGVSAIYFTVDGTTPTVGGDDILVFPAAIGWVDVPVGDNAAVKLISAGTPAYSVQVAR